MNILIRTQIILLLCLLSLSANAWEQHALIAQPVFANMEELSSADSVRVTSIEEFLMLSELYLEELLQQEEQWAIKNLDFYDPLPEALTFQASGDEEDIRLRYIEAIRINPQAKLISYLQLLPNQVPGERRMLTPEDVTPLKQNRGLLNVQYVELEQDSKIDPLSVLIAATDEPDLALDIGLYEDNGTEWGQRYGLGKQPFGSPTLEYGSQAPMHMGLYHESAIVNAVAPFIKKGYPEYRIHLYKSLSELAFSLGQDYWGWRFMGWGLHYIGDLTQPYHAQALPGVGTLKMLFINLMDMMGKSKMKDEAIQLVANRHTVTETLERQLLERVYMQADWDYMHYKTLASPRTVPHYIDLLPRAVISKNSQASSKKLNKALNRSIPANFISDPQFDFGNSDEKYEILKIVEDSANPEDLIALEGVLNDLIDEFSTYGRSYVRSIRSNSP